MMESLDQLSCNDLEVMDVERGSINSSIMNIDRNKIEAIPKTNQPIELQDLTGLTVYDVNHFEQEVLQQVTNEVLDNKTIYNTVEIPTVTLGVLGIEETEIERKIRTGEMTPFGSTDVSQKNTKSSEDMLEKYLISQSKLSTMVHKPKIKSSSTKKDFKINMESKEPIEKSKESGSEYFPSTDSEDESSTPVKIKSKKRSNNHPKCSQYSDDDFNGSDDEYFEPRRSSQYKSSDDGIVENYECRLRDYEKNNPEIATDNDDVFHSIDGDYFKVPKEIWEKLYKYQKIGIKWLWELHQQGSGGILGDEMGLGKTIQMIVFFGALYWSRLKDKITGIRGLGSSLIVCPATLMHQWVDEFHKWCPPIRVVVLHETGVYKGKPADLIKEVWSSKGVLITTYNGLLQHINHLLKNDWHYVILDEGHKIRNPDSKITVAAKQLKSSHKIIISGSPIQNHLKELWSLFDFIFPSKLGTLPAFIKSFAVPITHGGYANATELQITTAYKCATILKDTISPYLLRRMKADIQSHISLPDKSEQVLFCRLTEEQKTMYRGYLQNSDIISEIMNGNCKVFVGISRLRSICNHPDIFQTNLETGAYGYWKKSGKMIVVEALLKMWKKQGHRVLLFTQSVKMLNIFQKFITEQNYSYLKLEGSTSIGSRQPIINKFNNDPSIFVMILTTKVGGLGVNLIGADRVIIFDPDWNPATDLQARERAWRIGQTNSVTIYRLLTAGTIEEKMYHRQIFKQFLSNKVLVDPKQRRFFKSNYLYELFTLQDVDDNGVVETSDLFSGTGSEINLKKIMTARRERKKSKKTSSTCSFSDDKIEAMKQKARELSKMIGQNSKTVINQQITPLENNMCTNSEHCSDVDIICKNDIDTSKNNDKSVTFANNDSSSIPSCSKSPSSNHAFKRSNSKYLNTKHKKPKIPYLVKCDIYQEEHVDNLTSKKQDDYVLEKLFNKSGVKAVMRHDKIMESSKSDYVIIENEAQKLAKKAIEDLEASRSQCWETGSGRLNWTGSQGTVRSKLFHSMKNDDKSSGPSILSLMKKRSGIVEATEHETQMLNSIREYLLENNQSVSTDQIVNQFRNKYSAEDTPLFKSLLSEVCTFNRCPDKTGVWTLKPKYC
ncbi:DNA excision repair protein ERCC-6-like isoform X1 [Aphis gossypii]|uniref:DNA excision repair protein ERCC-6-like isoform X1 n=1 Tax=Aphis gossypii TaxID=80765 RepID=UPI002158F487|nr:DNA excision repair protein ERCC-6-like isoform X1 [Aphis gossypii]XP_027841631.2 DNA excision repair protein ERCC-6-like isoform X1 [Aphis gossypii]